MRYSVLPVLSVGPLLYVKLPDPKGVLEDKFCALRKSLKILFVGNLIILPGRLFTLPNKSPEAACGRVKLLFSAAKDVGLGYIWDNILSLKGAEEITSKKAITATTAIISKVIYVTPGPPFKGLVITAKSLLYLVRHNSEGKSRFHERRTIMKGKSVSSKQYLPNSPFFFDAPAN